MDRPLKTDIYIIVHARVDAHVLARSDSTRLQARREESSTIEKKRLLSSQTAGLEVYGLPEANARNRPSAFGLTKVWTRPADAASQVSHDAASDQKSRLLSLAARIRKGSPCSGRRVSQGSCSTSGTFTCVCEGVTGKPARPTDYAEPALSGRRTLRIRNSRVRARTKERHEPDISSSAATTNPPARWFG